MFKDVLKLEVGQKYEEECESYSVGIRAIWLLWRWGRKTQIKHIGLDWKEVQNHFLVFDLMHINSEHGGIRGEKQTQELVVFCSQEDDDFSLKLVQAAVDLVALYQLVTLESRLNGDSVR